MLDKYEWHPRPPSRSGNVAWAITIAVLLANCIARSFDVVVLGRYNCVLVVVTVAVQIVLTDFGPSLRRR